MTLSGRRNGMPTSVRPILYALATIVLGFTRIAASEAATQHLYGVIFGITIDEKGELISLRVSKVIDPKSGSTDAVDVAVPDSYVSAVRELVIAKKYEPRLKDGKPVEFFTWFYFDPADPTRADVTAGG